MKNICTVLAVAAIATASAIAPAQPVAIPATPRDFRGVWVATVSNIDWPRTSDSTATQQTKLRQIFDKAVSLNCNVIVFQVRPACDAFYQSSIEPWSQWLKGKQGTAPSPFYDPLQFAIDEAHKRGLELHAWFNPYRAGYTSNSYFAPNHITQTRPDLIRTYSSYYWLDPGEPEVQTYSLSVVMDVLNRYDIDGVHFDDYFYPYSDGTAFPDSTSYAKYGGGLSLSNWRRKNVNDFVQDVYTTMKASTKPEVRFGISPFGIWRPGNPAGITGLDSYSEIYADSKLWLNSGWVDYFAPQLYWKLHQTGHPYDQLMNWWVTQNTHDRVLCPGLYTSKVTFGGSDTWNPQDIIDEVNYTQTTTGGDGNIHFSAQQFMSTSAAATQLVTGLQNGPYAKQALVPPSTWLDNVPPPAPSVTFTRTSASAPWVINWTATPGETPWLYVVHYLVGTQWKQVVVPSITHTYSLPGTGAAAPTWAAVSSVDRVSNESTRTIVRLSTPVDAMVVH